MKVFPVQPLPPKAYQGGHWGSAPPRNSEIHSFQVRMERKIFKSPRTNTPLFPALYVWRTLPLKMTMFYCRVGETFHASQPSITVDGFTDPSNADRSVIHGIIHPFIHDTHACILLFLHPVIQSCIELFILSSIFRLKCKDILIFFAQAKIVKALSAKPYYIFSQCTAYHCSTQRKLI